MDISTIEEQVASLQTPIIQVIFGTSDENIFHVHEGNLCATSPFFENMMKPEWASARADPGIIELPGDDVEGFKVYLTWIYSKSVPIAGQEAGFASQRFFTTLAKAYVFGEKLMDIEFKNTVLDTLIRFRRKIVDGMPAIEQKMAMFPSAKDASIMFLGTPPDSPARSLLRDLCFYYGYSGYQWLNFLKDCPRDLLQAVLQKVMEERDEPPAQHGSHPWDDYSHCYYE